MNDQAGNTLQSLNQVRLPWASFKSAVIAPLHEDHQPLQVSLWMVFHMYNQRSFLPVCSSVVCDITARQRTAIISEATVIIQSSSMRHTVCSSAKTVDQHYAADGHSYLHIFHVILRGQCSEHFPWKIWLSIIAQEDCLQLRLHGNHSRNEG